MLGFHSPHPHKASTQMRILKDIDIDTEGSVDI